MLQEFERALALGESIASLKASMLAKERKRYEAQRQEIERSAEAATFILKALSEPKDCIVYGIARGYQKTFEKMHEAEVQAKRKREREILDNLRKDDDDNGKDREPAEGSNEPGGDGIETFLSAELPQIEP